jgi:hypothetical protein
VFKGVTVLDVVSYKEQGTTVKGMGADHLYCLTLTTRLIYTAPWTSTSVVAQLLYVLNLVDEIANWLEAVLFILIAHDIFAGESCQREWGSG